MGGSSGGGEGHMNRELNAYVREGIKWGVCLQENPREIYKQ